MSDDDKNWERIQRERQAERERDRVARLNVVSLFDRLGYDLEAPGEVQRLAATFRFIEEERKRREAMASNKVKWLGAFLLAVLGSAATIFVNWLGTKFIPGGLPK